MNNAAHKPEPQHFASTLDVSEVHTRGRHEVKVAYSVHVPGVNTAALDRALEGMLPSVFTTRTSPAPKRQRIGNLFVNSTRFHSAARDVRPEDTVKVTITFQDTSAVKDDNINKHAVFALLRRAFKMIDAYGALTGILTPTERRIQVALDGIVQAAHERAVATSAAHDKALHVAKTAEHIGSWISEEAAKTARERVRFEERLAALVDEYKAATRAEATERLANPPRFYDEERTAPIEPEVLALLEGFRADFIEDAVSRANAGRGMPRTVRPVIDTYEHSRGVAFLAAALFGQGEEVGDVLRELSTFGRPSDED